ncbi:MAG: hypothetical protein ACOX1S_10275 [Anaerostipes sp.]|jgi:hypothetical protein
MANIKPYTDQIEGATYGEEVRSSIVNALNKVNEDNESYQAIKDEIVAANDDMEQHVADFDAKVAAARTATSELTGATSTANTARSNLNNATSTANTAHTNVVNATNAANTAKANVDAATQAANTATGNANTAKTNLDGSVSKAETAKTNVDASTSAANTAKTNLDGSVKTANTSKSNLDGSITNASTAKGELDDTIADAGTSKTNLSGTISQAETKRSELQGVINTGNTLQATLTEQNTAAGNNLAALQSENFNSREILTGVDDIKAYIGYTDEDIVGIQVDYENKSFQRLAGAYELSAGVDFDKYAMFGGRKRCTVADDGTIVTWFGDADYAEDGTMGQVMVYQPKFYYKVVPLKTDPITDGIGQHLRKANYYVSTKPKTGFKLHPFFIDKNGDELEYAMLSAYEGSIFDTSADAYLLDDSQAMAYTTDKFSSIAGAKPASGKTQDLTRPKVEQMAQNRGTDWHGDLIKAVSANQLLMIIELGTMNTQVGIGNGVVSVPDNPNTENNSIVTGGTSSLGNDAGMAAGTNGQVSVSYRGVENPWGNVWKFVYGVNIYGNGSMKGGVPYICSDFAFAESKNSGNYESAGFTLSNADGYISAMGYSEAFDYLFFPSECVGNSSLPVGDYLWRTTNLNGYRIARLGGCWSGGGRAGGFWWFLDDGVGFRSRAVGGRLVYVPTKATNTAYITNFETWQAIMAA